MVRSLKNNIRQARAKVDSSIRRSRNVFRGVIAENEGLIRRRAKVSTINLRTEIAEGGEGVASRGSRTVCRILSLYNLTPLLQKLRGKLKDEETRGRRRTYVNPEEKRDGDSESGRIGER